MFSKSDNEKDLNNNNNNDPKILMSQPLEITRNNNNDIEFLSLEHIIQNDSSLEEESESPARSRYSSHSSTSFTVDHITPESVPANKTRYVNFICCKSVVKID